MVLTTFSILASTAVTRFEEKNGAQRPQSLRDRRKEYHNIGGMSPGGIMPDSMPGISRMTTGSAIATSAVVVYESRCGGEEIHTDPIDYGL